MRIETTLVTNEMYAKFIAETGYRDPLVWPGCEKEYPVLGVSRVDAQEYCKWANTRLPTYDELPIEIVPYWLWTSDMGESQYERFAVLRGGSWFDFHGRARCAYRNYFHPAVRSVITGFRCVREVTS